MRVIVPETSGFCPGVKRAEDGVFKLRESRDEVNLHGPLIHNQNYMSMLQTHNIQSVNIDNLQEGETLVIRTHGISRYEEEQLNKKFKLQDLTCPIVKRVQKHIENASSDNAFVIISGKSNHAEVQGLVSYAKYYLVIETPEELNAFLESYHSVIPEHCSSIFLLSQTTYSREFFQLVCNEIQQTITNTTVNIKDTICPVTENKEKESLQLQKEVDFTVVIGDPHSSNSKKLYAILKEDSEHTLFTQNLNHLKEIKKDWSDIQTVLVVSSTSTPLFVEKEIVEYLEQI